MDINRIEEISNQIIKYARNELMVSLRFMDLALCKLEYKMENVNSLETDGEFLYYNPKFIFELYKSANNNLTHTYLHSVFHCIFYHPFIGKDINKELWDLACDIAVEGIISELQLKQIETARSNKIDAELQSIKQKYGALTAERLYKKFSMKTLANKELKKLKDLFAFDEHNVWYINKNDKEPRDEYDENDTGGEGSSGSNSWNDSNDQDTNKQSNDEYSNSSNSEGTANTEKNNQSQNSAKDDWQEISERVKVDLETASKEWGDRSANLLQNITEVNREKYDYSDFLQKFSVLGEDMQINDEEFDYIFYTYGLQLYKNIPLVEPLEYKDVKKIREFVIAIDTSGSVQGDLVRRFITKTYNILSQQSNFFSKVNIHIIQCDTTIQNDIKITCKEDFEKYARNIELRGFGGTDFRPVFEYVDSMMKAGELTNLKGLIYFTDGYGTFPTKKPPYETAFVFVDDNYGQPSVPVWAIKLVLAKDEI